MNRFKVTTPPAPIVTLAEAKLFLRVDSDQTAEDVFITSIVAAATAFCEELARRSFGQQTLTAYLDEWPCDGTIWLPRPALRSVTSIKYRDTAGVEQTLAPELYQVDEISEPGRVRPAPGGSWPTLQSGRLNAVAIEYLAGWAADKIDQRAREGVLCLVAHWYANREAVVTGTISKEIELAVGTLMTQLWHGRLP